MKSVMAIAARKEKLALTGMACEVETHMSADLPRRITRLDASVTMPQHLTSEQRVRLEQIGNTCPVIQSLASGVEVAKRYIYA